MSYQTRPNRRRLFLPLHTKWSSTHAQTFDFVPPCACTLIHACISIDRWYGAAAPPNTPMQRVAPRYLAAYQLLFDLLQLQASCLILSIFDVKQETLGTNKSENYPFIDPWL